MILNPYLILLGVCEGLWGCDHLAVQLDVAGKYQILCCAPGCNPRCR